MTEPLPRILLVDDDPPMLGWLSESLARRGFSPSAATTAARALEVMANEPFDAVVTDLAMPGRGGIWLSGQIAERFPEVPVLVLTAFGSLESAIEAIRAGAYDYLTKPIEIDVLALALTRAVTLGSLRREVKRLRAAVESPRALDDLVGASAPMVALYDLLERVADSDSTVLVTGESGTGKEVVARALHRRGPRAKGPFVAINCAAMPETLLESELFGHARGAFTDAKAPRRGLFQQADGGTLFLDEIAEMPLGMQPKLLRALQERRFRPVGGEEVSFDARIVAATNRDLEEAVEERRFREDLYYRINVIHVELPPLRSRGADVLLLAQHFLTTCAARAGKDVTGLTPGAAEKLLAYPFPGNVRELSNCIERAVALTRHSQLTAEDLPPKIQAHKPSHVVVASDDPAELVPLEEVERRYILRVLEAVGGNKTKAAEVLGLDRKTLYRKLDRYEAG